MRDAQNMFLLSFNAEQSSTQLFRVEDGEPSLLTQSAGARYHESVWQRVRIEMHHGRIRVAVNTEGKEWTPVLE